MDVWMFALEAIKLIVMIFGSVLEVIKLKVKDGNESYRPKHQQK